MESGAAEFGRMAAIAAGLLALALIFLNALRRVPDPAYERKCPLGMVWVAAGWLLGSVTLLGTARGGGLFFAGFGVALGLVVVGTILAWLGLVLPSERRGRRLASWAILLAVVFIGLAGWGWWTLEVAKPAHRVPPDWAAPTVRAPGSKIVNRQKGFSFTVPPAPWLEIRTEYADKAADFAFLHETAGVTFALRAVRFRSDEPVSLEDLVKRAHEEIRTLDPEAHVGEPADQAAGMILGQSLRSTVLGPDGPRAYRHWLAVTPRSSLSLIAWAPAAAEAELDALLAQLLKGLELLD